MGTLYFSLGTASAMAFAEAYRTTSAPCEALAEPYPLAERQQALGGNMPIMKGKIMRYWYEGFDARRAGLDYSANPYGRGSAESAHWKSGWLSAGHNWSFEAQRRK